MNNKHRENCECPMCGQTKLLAQILERLFTMANTIDDLLAATTAQTTLVASLQAFVSGLQAQIGTVGLTPDQQTKVNQIFSTLTADNAALTAIQANTPAANPAPVTPATPVTPAATATNQTSPA